MPAARGTGLGPRLLAEVMARQDFGARDMTLGVSRCNPGALRFYQRLGFRSRGDDFMILDGNPLAALADTEMITSTLHGGLFFADFPNGWTFVGVAVLIACAICNLMHEPARAFA